MGMNCTFVSHDRIYSLNKLTGTTNWKYSNKKLLFQHYLIVKMKVVYYQMFNWEDEKTTVGAFYYGDKPLNPDSEQKETYPANKPWKITFNSAVNEQTINNNTIYVLDSNNNHVSGIEYVVKDKVVEVKAPANGYTSKETYKLVITKEVQSQSNVNLSKVTEKEFTIQ